METSRKEEDRKHRPRGELRKTVLRANGLRFSALELGEGPAVLCLHGFPDYFGTWREQMSVLAEAGYRVIAPMLRGYEPSSQPRDGSYHFVDLVEDVRGWMDDLGLDKAHLVGHDWGGTIAYMTAAKAPERFHSLTTLAVPHSRYLFVNYPRFPHQIRSSWYVYFFLLGPVADAAVRRNGFQFIEDLWRDWSPGWQWPAEELASVKEVFRQPGVAKAAVDYYRAFFKLWTRASQESQKLLVRPIHVPTLALTGELDGAMDTRLHEPLMKPEMFPAGMRIERLQGAGHFLHQEKPAEVNRLLVDWLRQHTP